MNGPSISQPPGKPAPDHERQADITPEDAVLALNALTAGEQFDLGGPLTPTGHLRRRQLVSRVAQTAQVGSALVALAVLAIVVF